MHVHIIIIIIINWWRFM